MGERTGDGALTGVVGEAVGAAAIESLVAAADNWLDDGDRGLAHAAMSKSAAIDPTRPVRRTRGWRRFTDR